MSAITFEDGRIEVKAELVAKGLLLTPEALRLGMQDGSITSLCEQGIDADAGRYRLTFYSPSQRMRLTVDAQGNVLQTSTVPFVRRPQTRP